MSAMAPVFPSMPIQAFSPFACYNFQEYFVKQDQTSKRTVIYNKTWQTILTFPCSAVIVRMTFTPQFCAKVRGIASKAIAAASYGHCQSTRILSENEYKQLHYTRD